MDAVLDDLQAQVAAWAAANPELAFGGALLLLLGCWLAAHINSRTVDAPPKVIGPHGKSLPTIRTTGSKPRGPVYIPFTVGPVTVDLQPGIDDTIHVLIAGTSGLGKTTTVLDLLDLPIGVLVVAMDDTVPILKKIRSVGGIDWTNDPRQCAIGLNLLGFAPDVSSELVVAGLPKADGDSGQWRRSARARIWRTLEEADRRGIERSWEDVIAALRLQTNDFEADRACRSWASKLEQVYWILGHALGPGLDLVEAMRARKKVLLRVNHFLSPDDAPMIGGWLMQLARVVAAEAGIPFVLIAEEAGQLDTFKQHLRPVAVAARARGVVGIFICQNPSKLPDEVTNNCSVQISYAHELEAEQRFMAHKLRLHFTQLFREAFPPTRNPAHRGRGWCYIRAPGVPTTLVQVRPRPLAPAPALARVDVDSADAGMPDQRWARRIHVEQLDGWRPWTPALPVAPGPTPSVEPPPAWLGLDAKYIGWWNQCARSATPSILWSPSRGVFYDPKGCLEWGGTLSIPADGRPARPRATDHGRKHGNPYRVFYRLFHGQLPEPTADHLCDNPICCDPEHIEPCGTSEQNERAAQRTKMFRLAGWERISYMRGKARLTKWVGEIPIAA